MRSRLLDLAVATVCVGCVCAPLLPIVNAASGPSNPVVESGGSVDQRVVEGGIISSPLNGSFDSGGSGLVDGTIQWDLYSTAARGMKLVVSSDRTPAMRDAANGIDVPDQGASYDRWSVSGSDRRFGVSAMGPIALSRFDEGRRWRGFDGRRGIEVARRGAPIGRVRTTVRLRAEFGSSLPSNARPTANVIATAVPNI
jgi:hypothetical protein